MNPIIYDFMNGMWRYYFAFLFGGTIIQIIISLKAKGIFGLILPIYALACVLFWITNPIREGNEPTMTAVIFIPYGLLFIAYMATLLICKRIKKN